VIERRFAFLRIDVQQRFEIRAGAELAFELICLGQFYVIVDLAIADNGAARRMQWLPAASRSMMDSRACASE